MSHLPLPTGTVTFLFTDIEGSTRLVQALGDRWVDVLEAHNEILRTAIEHAGGIVVKTEGDAFFAVFVASTDAVAAAAAAQRALAGRSWPEGAPVRVRMGVHTGTGTLGGDDYVGLDIHRAARIADAAHGGQTVVSEATAVLVERALPEGALLRDSGKHRLKDLADPETLFELVIEGLEQDFPPLRTLEAVPNNLPSIATSFVGREQELADALRLLERTRVLTLTGPGGTGKTRLALQIGAERGDRFEDGVFFVDLAPVTDADLVPSRVLDSLDVPAPSGRTTPERALLDHLARSSLLAILDNFEQVVAAAPLVADMAAASPRSKFVVTSRGPLHIGGEQELPVQPLAVPDGSGSGSPLDADAVRLFTERAMTVRPDFALTDDNTAAVVELVRKLDGLPLAIELVATQVRLFPVTTIVERLDTRILSSRAVDLPERQRTIERAIDWSHDLLDEPRRLLFARLSVFAGGGRIEEVEQVCGRDGTGVVDGLEVLLDQSLVFPMTVDGHSRVRMLQVIREFASARLSERGEEERQTRRRHLEVYTDLAEQVAATVLGHDRKACLDRIEADHDNVRAALDWAVADGEADLGLRLAAATWRFWQARGHLHEARRRLEEVLALDGGTPARRAKATEALGGVLWWQGRVADCLVTYQQVLDMQREVGDAREIANALYNLALAIDFAGVAPGTSSPEALAALDEAEEIYRGLGDVGGLGDVAWGRGNAHLVAQDPDKAVQPFRESMEHYRRAGNEFGQGWSLYELGFLAIRSGELDAADDYLRTGLELFAGHRDESAAVMFLAAFAALARLRGDDDHAYRLAGAFHHLRITTGTDLVAHTVNLPVGMEYETLEALTGDRADQYRAGLAMGYDEAVGYVLARPALET